MNPASYVACNGWAYETCWRRARWVLREIWHDGHWQEHHLCNWHVEAVFAGIDSESDPPAARIWVHLTTKRTEKTPLASPSVPSASATPLPPTCRE